MKDCSFSYAQLIRNTDAASVLSLAELETLESAIKAAMPDRGGRLIVKLENLPTRIRLVINTWGRLSPEIVLDEVEDAILELAKP